VNGFRGALGGELVATGAAHFAVRILGMDAVSHDLPRLGK